MGVIIDTHGNVLQAWFRKNGNIIHDSENKYDTEFHIGIDYTEDQKNRYAAIKQLKKYLESSDYQAIKFSDGAITEEEYAPIRAKRAAARAQINELEFEEPTLTREQMDYYEDLVMAKNTKEES
jgi:hypothetical protein